MEFVISLRRAFRETAPEDWPDKIRAMAGVTPLSAPFSGRMTVEASEDARARLERELGEAFIIEPIIRHDPSTGG